MVAVPVPSQLRVCIAAALVLGPSFAGGSAPPADRGEIGTPSPPTPPLGPDVPSAIRIVFGSDPTTEVTVAWATATPAPQSVRLRGPGGPREVPAAVARWPDLVYDGGVTFDRDYLLIDKLQEIVTEDVKVYGYTGRIGGVSFLHVARVDGLKPGREYRYSVGGGAVWSDEHRFRTAPEAGDARKVTFTAFGDSMPTPAGALVARRAAADRPDFHVHLGDVSYAGDQVRPTTEPHWLAWFGAYAPLLENAPFMPAMGNHDDDLLNGSYYYHHRMFPFASDAPPAWDFRYGDVAVVSVYADNEKRAPRPGQIEYARAALERHADARWKVLAVHSGPYGTGPEHGAACPLRTAIEPLLDEFDVDLVLSAHDHVYERTRAIRLGAVVGTSPEGTVDQGAGTVFVIAGTGGAKPYAVKPNGLGTRIWSIQPYDKCAESIEYAMSYSAARIVGFGHVRVTATAAELRVQYVDAVTGLVLDRATIRAAAP